MKYHIELPKLKYLEYALVRPEHQVNHGDRCQRRRDAERARILAARRARMLKVAAEIVKRGDAPDLEPEARKQLRLADRRTTSRFARTCVRRATRAVNRINTIKRLAQNGVES